MGESSRECENGYKVQIEYDVANRRRGGGIWNKMSNPTSYFYFFRFFKICPGRDMKKWVKRFLKIKITPCRWLFAPLMIFFKTTSEESCKILLKICGGYTFCPKTPPFGNQCCRMGLFQRIVGNHIRICMCGCLSCAITIPTVKNLIYKLRLRSPQLGYSPWSIIHFERVMSKIPWLRYSYGTWLPETAWYISCSSFLRLRVYCMVQ